MSQSDKIGNAVDFARELHDRNKTSIKRNRVFLYFDEEHVENYVNSDSEDSDSVSDSIDTQPSDPLLNSDFPTTDPVIMEEISRFHDEQNFVSNSALTSL